jgi:hypothetical protein
MNLFQSSANFLLAFILITIIGVYILNVPSLLTGHREVVDLYYKKNWKWSIPLDFFLVVVYFAIAKFVWNVFNIEKTAERLLALVATTILLTGGWCIWFNSRPMTKSFFSIWFHKVGWRAVLYDVILLSSIYIIYVYLMS